MRECGWFDINLWLVTIIGRNDVGWKPGCVLLEQSVTWPAIRDNESQVDIFILISGHSSILNICKCLKWLMTGRSTMSCFAFWNSVYVLWQTIMVTSCSDPKVWHHLTAFLYGTTTLIQFIKDTFKIPFSSFRLSFQLNSSWWLGKKHHWMEPNSFSALIHCISFNVSD